MATCTTCNGAGSTEGSFETCYSCGGRGYGGHTNVSCTACGGSGQSSMRQRDTCWNCNGAGQIADPEPRRSSAKHRDTTSNQSAAPNAGSGQSSGKSKKEDDWTGWNTFFMLLAYWPCLNFVSKNTELEGWWLYLVTLIPAALIGRMWQLVLVGGIIYFGYQAYEQGVFS